MRILIIIFLMVGFLLASDRPVHAQRRPMKQALKDEGPDKNFAKAVLGIRNNKTDAAVAILRQNIEHYPDHWPSYLLLAKIEHRRKNYNDALKLVKQAIRLNPGNKTAYLLAADIFQKENKTLKAAAFLRRAQKADDDAEEDEIRLNRDESESIQAQILKSKQGNTVALKFQQPQSENSESLDATLPPIEESQQLKIAVIAFEVNDSTEKNLGETLAEMMTTAMVQTNRFQVVERQQIHKILQEQDFEMSDAVSQEAAVEVGEFIGVDAVLIGHCLKMKSSNELDGRLVEIKTGKILTAANANYRADQPVRPAVNGLAVSLAKTAYK